MITVGTNLLVPARIALAAALLAVAGGAATAADARHEDQRAACLQRPQAERDSCLREAAAARQALRKGALDTDASYESNRIRRCEPVPASERDACIRRARGEGAVSGSVEGGGILREYREITLPPAVAAPALPAAPAAPDSLPPAGSIQPAPALAPAAPHPAPAGVMLEQSR